MNTTKNPPSPDWPESFHSAWQMICSRPADLEGLPASRWKHAWSTHPSAARRIHNAVLWQKPRTIIETGTFEGLGTYAMAKAAAINGGGTIYTVDYDGDPEASIPPEDWQQLRDFRLENLEKARADFPSVKIVFLDGDSRIVLPHLFRDEKIVWDLFFQDSMHFTAGILAEWRIVKPHASPQALAIFDDVCLDWRKLPSHLAGHRDFCLHFVLCEALGRGWRWKSTGEGRGQFFAKKMRD